MLTCKDCIHFKICNDYVYLIGRENKVACPDYKSTEDVVPRSEVEELQKKLDVFNKFEVVPLSEAKDKIKQAKQEVARAILEDFEKIKKLIKRTFDYDWSTQENAKCVIKKIEKIEKKYIGE